MKRARQKDKQGSKYSEKMLRQKAGIFSKNSPFRLVEGPGRGLGLSEFNRKRFRYKERKHS